MVSCLYNDTWVGAALDEDSIDLGEAGSPATSPMTRTSPTFYDSEYGLPTQQEQQMQEPQQTSDGACTIEHLKENNFGALLNLL